MVSHSAPPPKPRPGFLAVLTGKAQREAAAFLAQDFSERCPLPAGRRKALPAREVEQALGALYRGAADFSRAGRLGILGRARLAKALQDELLARGYPADMALKVVHAVAAKSLIGKPPRETTGKTERHRN